MNLLRVFLEDADCDPLNSLFTTGGQGAVTSEMMARLRAIFGADTVPDPLDGFYRYEKDAYQLTRPGAGFTASQMFAWAKQPLAGEKICMASEGFNALDAGWQEGAVVSAHNCLRGQVFQDLYQPGDVNKFERCSNPYTNRDLIKGNSQSENDLCMLLSTEFHMRDLAGLNYCGGPSVITAEVDAGTQEVTASSQASDWSGVSTDPVTDAPLVRRGRYIAV